MPVFIFAFGAFVAAFFCGSFARHGLNFTVKFVLILIYSAVSVLGCYFAVIGWMVQKGADGLFLLENSRSDLLIAAIIIDAVMFLLAELLHRLLARMVIVGNKEEIA